MFRIWALIQGAILLICLATGCSSEPIAEDTEKIRQPDTNTKKEPETSLPVADNGLAQQQNMIDETPVKAIYAKIIEITDGDTIRVHFESGEEERVRLIGVDTPESTREIEHYGKEAAAFTKGRLYGKAVFLEFDVNERDRFGRVLAYVWLDKPLSDNEEEVRAKMFNAELLLQGYAQVMTIPPNVKYADMFLEFEREARKNGIGLWAAVSLMPSILYNKLVRDKIPEIIAESGKQPVIEILDDKSYKDSLDAKLAEEVNEYMKSDSVEELADLTEVIMAIFNYKRVSHDQFDEIRNEKNNKRGRFDIVRKYH